MSQIRTAAILSLFRDEFHIEDLAEIFGLSSRDIQALLRIALTNGKPATPPAVASIATPKSKSATGRKTRATVAKSATVQRRKLTSAAPLAGEPIKPPKRTGECEEHAGSGVSTRNECRGCLRAYQQDWNARRKQGATTETKPKRQRRRHSRVASDLTPASSETPEQTSTVGAAAVEDFAPETAETPVESNESGGHRPPLQEAGKVYSVLIQCPKCSQRHRFWKRANADDSRDHWISMACQNSLKISHYQIKVDRNYRGEAA